MQVRESNSIARLPRRRMLAFGAAALASAALAACGGGGSATETPKPAASAPGGLAGTAQAIASAAPAGAASTVQAVASAVPGGAAASPAASPAANTANVASRDGKYKTPPPMTIDKAKKYTATIATNKGTMKAELYADTAPVTVNNFVFLANDHFFDGVIFHRIVAGFVIQGGDPTGTGMGGPGYGFANEPSSLTRNYEKGTLAMAHSAQPNSNGSQFFICLDNLTAKGALPKEYNVFGKVTDGLDVVDKIAATPTKPDQRGEKSVPTEKVFMESVTIQTT